MATNHAKDRQLRRALLRALEMNSGGNAPMNGVNGLSLVNFVASGYVAELSFDDDGHALSLIRDLGRKGLLTETPTAKLASETFGPKHLFLKITDRGTLLVKEKIPPDPDIADERDSDPFDV